MRLRGFCDGDVAAGIAHVVVLCQQILQPLSADAVEQPAQDGVIEEVLRALGLLVHVAQKADDRAGEDVSGGLWEEGLVGLFQLLREERCDDI